MILILSMVAAYASEDSNHADAVQLSGDDAIIEEVQNNATFNSIQEQLFTRRQSNQELQILKKQGQMENEHLWISF